MSALVYANSQSEEMKLLAKRIEVSQIDEIGMMKDWLTARRETLPDEHAHHAGDHALMPGMLTQAEMKRLASAKGVEFDRLFLEGMIKHHQGALTMVKELFATPRAGQDAEIFAFASDVDADQSMEIDRMAAMLASVEGARAMRSVAEDVAVCRRRVADADRRGRGTGAGTALPPPPAAQTIHASASRAGSPTRRCRQGARAAWPTCRSRKGSSIRRVSTA